jgi:hypothetical protein
LPAPTLAPLSTFTATIGTYPVAAGVPESAAAIPVITTPIMTPNVISPTVRCLPARRTRANAALPMMLPP